MRGRYCCIPHIRCLCSLVKAAFSSGCIFYRIIFVCLGQAAAARKSCAVSPQILFIAVSRAVRPISAAPPARLYAAVRRFRLGYATRCAHRQTDALSRRTYARSAEQANKQIRYRKPCRHADNNDRRRRNAELLVQQKPEKGTAERLVVEIIRQRLPAEADKPQLRPPLLRTAAKQRHECGYAETQTENCRIFEIKRSVFRSVGRRTGQNQTENR